MQAEHRRVRGAAVEDVARDGRADPRQVHPDLVRAAGAGRHRQERRAVGSPAQAAVFGERCLAPLAAHLVLVAAVHPAGDGRLDPALGPGRGGVDQRQVRLPDAAPAEQLVHGLLGRLVFGEQQHARGGLVQAVEHRGAVRGAGAGQVLGDAELDTPLLARGRQRHRRARRLVHHQQVVVFEQDGGRLQAEGAERLVRVHAHLEAAAGRGG